MQGGASLKIQDYAGRRSIKNSGRRSIKNSGRRIIKNSRRRIVKNSGLGRVGIIFSMEKRARGVVDLVCGPVHLIYETC